MNEELKNEGKIKVIKKQQFFNFSTKIDKLFSVQQKITFLKREMQFVED